MLHKSVDKVADSRALICGRVTARKGFQDWKVRRLLLDTMFPCASGQCRCMVLEVVAPLDLH